MDRFANGSHGALEGRRGVSSFICCFSPSIFHCVSVKYGPPTSTQGERLLIDTAFFSFPETKQNQTKPKRRERNGVREGQQDASSSGCSEVAGTREAESLVT